MASSLSNLAEGIHEIKCIYGHNIKSLKLAELKTKTKITFLST